MGTKIADVLREEQSYRPRNIMQWMGSEQKMLSLKVKFFHPISAFKFD